MATIREVVDGLQILAKYCGEDGMVEGQHDVIFAGPDADGLTPEDAATLKSLGWHVDEQTESWALFT